MDDVGTQRAHAKVAIAVLASLYSTASADERGLAAVELGGMLPLVTAAKDPRHEPGARPGPMAA